jgi:hypothetical protein
MYVNECGFMTMIDQTIQFRSALPNENCTHEEYYHVLDMVLRLYSSAGFHSKTIQCDGEFGAMMDKVKDNCGVCMNFTNALDHVPQRQRGTTELSRNKYGRHITNCRQSTTTTTNPVFGAGSSQSVEFIPSQRRNITILQPK